MLCSKAAPAFNFQMHWHPLTVISSYVQTGKMIAGGWPAPIGPFSAIFLARVGHPVFPIMYLFGLLIPIRRTFRQYVNFVRSPFDGIESMVKNIGQLSNFFRAIRFRRKGERDKGSHIAGMCAGWGMKVPKEIHDREHWDGDRAQKDGTEGGQLAQAISGIIFPVCT